MTDGSLFDKLSKSSLRKPELLLDISDLGVLSPGFHHSEHPLIISYTLADRADERLESTCQPPCARLVHLEGG